MPSSLMSTLAPEVSTISRITLPPEPITSRILSVGMFMVSMRGRMGAERRAAFGQGLAHLAQDVHAAVLGLRQRLLHDLGRDARNLDVHLQRGDARLGCRRP